MLLVQFYLSSLVITNEWAFLILLGFDGIIFNDFIIYNLILNLKLLYIITSFIFTKLLLILFQWADMLFILEILNLSS